MLPDFYELPNFRPGKISIIGRPRGGDWLENEIKSLSLAGVNSLVSLLTPPEIGELGLQEEAKLCEKWGIEFIALPIADRSVPPNNKLFEEVVNKLLEQTAAGKFCVLHCRMSIGRSAVLATALLIKKGYALENVLEIVAQARGCSVPDTPEQVAWLGEFAKLGK